MKLPRKTVIDRQADHIRDTFDGVDDKSLAMLHGGQPRYGIVLPPREIEPTTTTDAPQLPTVEPPPQPATAGNDLLAPITPTKIN